MDLLGRLKNTNIIKKEKDNPEIDFIKSTKLNMTVNRGMAELYRIQPKNPITFLANWLMNESKSKLILKKIEEKNEMKREIEEKVIKSQDMLLKAEENKKRELEVKRKQVEEFKEFIVNSDNFGMHFNEICEQLKYFVNATGVYISTYDFKRKYPVGEEEDERAHLRDIKVIRYIYWCKDHSFLHRKFLEPGIGVTYSLIQPSEEQQAVDPNVNQAAGQEGGGAIPEPSAEVKEETKNEIKVKLVPDVIAEPLMKFFREPRLGCYMALDISYKSSMSSNSLLSAMECLKEFNENKEKQEERRKAYEERTKHRDSITHVSNQDISEGINTSQEVNEEWNEVPVVLNDFYKEPRSLILCLDTLGQDRVFSEEEKELIMSAAKLIKDSMENLEQKLLLKDRDNRIEYEKIEKILKETWTTEKIEQEEEKCVKEYLASEAFLQKNITDDRGRNIEADFMRARFIIRSIIEDPNMIANLGFGKFEFVEFEKLFQNVFYFVKIPGTDINEEDTNRLDWRKARPLWRKELLKEMGEYNPFGPKPGKVSYAFKGNRILANLESLLPRKEEIREYSFPLMRLLDYIILILRIRRDDIIRRAEEIAALQAKRNEIIEENEKILAERNMELEKQKLAAVDENGEQIAEFNEEEFLKKFDEEHPTKEVPHEVEFDLDEDFDV